MIVNKHGSFYLRSGWGTKIIYAVSKDAFIFAPNNEQNAVDELGLGRVMIKALRYWSDVMGLTTETKENGFIKKEPVNPSFELIKSYDPYFQLIGTLYLMHRNIALDKENATAWYWAFNEFKNQSFSKDEFVDGLHSYLAVNGLNIKRDAVEKEFNCFKNTYLGESNFDKRTIMDEDTYPFLAPLNMLRINDEKKFEKVFHNTHEVPLPVLLYSIAQDNKDESQTGKQISIDKLLEEEKQVGKYFSIKYQKLIEQLIRADNLKLIELSNNFGNRHIEFTDYPYETLFEKYLKHEELT